MKGKNVSERTENEVSQQKYDVSPKTVKKVRPQTPCLQGFPDTVHYDSSVPMSVRRPFSSG